MFCKNCGKEVNQNAVACMGCGCNPKTGNKFCSNCGVQVNPEQVVCVKCGAALANLTEIGKSETGKSKSRVTAAVLAFFAGGVGVHQFYLGHTASGVMRLVLFFGGFFLFLVGPLVMEMIAFIEGCIYFSKSDEEFQAVYVDGGRAWL